MGHNMATDGEYSVGVAFAIAWGKACPSLKTLVEGKGRYHLRELSVIYKGPGQWLAKVKALDTQDALPVIIFASADSHLAAFRRADYCVRMGYWKKDQYPGDNWAR